MGAVSKELNPLPRLLFQNEGKSMSRYYFDLHNGDGPLRDEIGLDLPSRDRVAAEASRILSDIARDEIPTHERGVISVKVRDADGQPIILTSLSFSIEWLDNPENSQQP